MELEEFEATELSAFKEDVKAEAACLLENAHLIIGTFDAAVDVVAEAISWALEHLLEAQPSEYRSRLKRQVIKTAIDFVRRAARSQLSWFKRGLQLLRYLAQRLMPLPRFYECPA